MPRILTCRDGLYRSCACSDIALSGPASALAGLDHGNGYVTRRTTGGDSHVGTRGQWAIRWVCRRRVRQQTFFSASIEAASREAGAFQVPAAAAESRTHCLSPARVASAPGSRASAARPCGSAVDLRYGPAFAYSEPSCNGIDKACKGDAGTSKKSWGARLCSGNRRWPRAGLLDPSVLPACVSPWFRDRCEVPPRQREVRRRRDRVDEVSWKTCDQAQSRVKGISMTPNGSPLVALTRSSRRFSASASAGSGKNTNPVICSCGGSTPSTSARSVTMSLV